MKSTVYLDYNATTPVDERVFARMAPCFYERFGNPTRREYTLGWDAAAAVDEARGHVADLINAEADQIVFTGGETESISCALRGLAQPEKGGQVITGSTEHQAVLATCRAIEA